MIEDTHLSLRFLKETDTYTAYVKNYIMHPNRYNRHNIKEDLQHSIDHLGTYYILNSSYKGWDWAKSNEGFDFWNDLHEKLKNCEIKI